MSSKPIVVEVTKATEGYQKGAVLGYESESDAKKVLGDGNFKITAHQDGTVYEAPKSSSKKSDDT
jgi:hypothetical protein